MFKRFLSVGGFTLLSRLTGFARDMLLAWMLGGGLISDAFFVAFVFPNNFRAIFGEGTINPAFLPRYAALHARVEYAKAARFADAVFSWQIAAQILLLAAAIVFMPGIIRLLAPGFAANPVQFALTVSLARVTFPYLILTLVAVQLSAMLNAIEKFWAAAAWSNLLNLSMIATLICWRWFPNAAYAAAWGVLLGGVAQLVFITWAASREGLRLKLSWPRWTAEIKEFFIAFGAVTIGAGSVVILPFIDTIIASLLPTGSRTALYYADRINQLPLGVWGLRWVRCCCRKCRGGWRAATAPARTRHRTAPRQRACCSLCRSRRYSWLFQAPSCGRCLPMVPSIRGPRCWRRRRWPPMARACRPGAGADCAATFYARHDTMTPARATVTAIVSISC